MPPTLEVACRNDDCELDMFELHYTYELVPAEGEVEVTAFTCPYCGRSDTLERLTYTYDDR